MKILAIGDIVGRCGRDILGFNLERIVYENEIDFVIANAENAAHGKGLSEQTAQELFDYGVDVMTMGNHTFSNKDIFNLMKYDDRIIRPANFPDGTAGKGYGIFEKNTIKIGVINAIGRVYMDPIDCPFMAVDKVLAEIRGKCDVIVVDFHAEATSEKIAMGWHLDGRASIVFGTHTHVQTADEKIMPKGTAYISDLGMTGAIYSVLGLDRKVVIDRFMTKMPSKFELADGASQICGAIFTTCDDEIFKIAKVERVNQKNM